MAQINVEVSLTQSVSLLKVLGKSSMSIDEKAKLTFSYLNNYFDS
jgi:hypothetical protein